MYQITFLSTIHKEIGKCNADELCSILNEIKPEVIFLKHLIILIQTMKSICFPHFINFIKK